MELALGRAGGILGLWTASRRRTPSSRSAPPAHSHRSSACRRAASSRN